MEIKGFVEIDGITYRLISRQKSSHKRLRIRTKGPVGIHLATEESFLEKNADYLKKLLESSEVDIPIGKDNGGADE
ncbi:hypothetical protein [Mesotoga sp.]|uniref:hypothetical protein n=1 Tax=Mesotoga sp. TaxID=2053577 RepID=UPI00345EC7A8